MSQKRWRKAHDSEYRVELKFLFLPAPIVLSLLTILLWFGWVSAGIAQRSPVKIPAKPLINRSAPNPPPSRLQLVASGKQISLNGRTFPAAWYQWDLDKNTGKVRTAINDAGLMQVLGVELLNTTSARKQPIVWFSQPTTSPLVLDSWHSQMYRYLDVTQLASAAWQMQANGDTLQITLPAARVTGIRQGKQTWGDRIVIDLDRPTAWQVALQKPAAKPKTPVELLDDPNATKLSPQNNLNKFQPRQQEWLVTIDATTDLAAIPDSPTNLALKAQLT